MAPDMTITDDNDTERPFEREDSSAHASASSPPAATGDEADDEVVHICKRCMTARPAASACPECGEPLVPIRSVQDSYLGEVVGGKYNLVEQIGSGGMGEVYLGVNEPLDQRVAVKFLSQKYSANEQIIMRFLNEARSYCRVNHPNAVTLLDYGQHDDGALYIITEYVEGISLTDAISEHGPLEPSKALSVTMQCCEVLSAAHDEGVIHRDLKPDNIMLMPASQDRYAVKVLDFGIAKIVDDERAALTKTGSVFGTPEFMSPEQAEGKTADPRSDLYALGILLFYTSTGRLPFEADSQFAVLEQQIHEAPPKASSVVDDAEVPEPIEGIVECCLKKPREERFESADQLYEALSGASERIGAGERESAPTMAERAGRDDEGDRHTIELSDIVDERGEAKTQGYPAGIESVDGRADTPLASEIDDLDPAAEVDVGRDFESVDLRTERSREPFQLPTPDRSRMPMIGVGVAVVLTAGIVGWQVWSGGSEPVGETGEAGVAADALSERQHDARARLSEAHAWLDEATVSQAKRSYREATEMLPEKDRDRGFGRLAKITETRIREVEATRDEFVEAVDGNCAEADEIGRELSSLAPEVADWASDRVQSCRAEESPETAESEPVAVNAGSGASEPETQGGDDSDTASESSAKAPSEAEANESETASSRDGQKRPAPGGSDEGSDAEFGGTEAVGSAEGGKQSETSGQSDGPAPAESDKAEAGTDNEDSAVPVPGSVRNKDDEQGSQNTTGGQADRERDSAENAESSDSSDDSNALPPREL